MSKKNAHPGYQKAAVELRGLAKQASDAIGIFVRWSVYIETNPDHAIQQMQKVLGSDPEKVNPRLREAATTVLEMVQPAALKQVAERKAKRDADRAKLDRRHERRRQLEKEGHSFHEAWRIAGAEAKSGKRVRRAKPAQDGNVVSVEFGGAS